VSPKNGRGVLDPGVLLSTCLFSHYLGSKDREEREVQGIRESIVSTVIVEDEHVLPVTLLLLLLLSVLFFNVVVLQV
jgi:hypothetical protein